MAVQSVTRESGSITQPKSPGPSLSAALTSLDAPASLFGASGAPASPPSGRPICRQETAKRRNEARRAERKGAPQPPARARSTDAWIAALAKADECIDAEGAPFGRIGTNFDPD